MLRCGSDSAALDAGDPGSCDRAVEQRVLGVALEAAPAERAAMDVHRRAEDNVHALAPRLFADERADAAHDVAIPRGGETGSARRTRSDIALVESLAADPVRAVGDLHRVETDLRSAGRPPQACSRRELHLALKRQPRDELVRRWGLRGRLNRHRLPFRIGAVNTGRTYRVLGRKSRGADNVFSDLRLPHPTVYMVGP